MAAASVPAATPEETERAWQGAAPALSGRATLDGVESLGGGLPAGGVLLVPDATLDRVMAFHRVTGDLVDVNFIPSDPANLSSPIEAILSSGGGSILVSDQVDDVVQEYDLAGSYLGVFAPAGGRNTSILDNIRGIALRPNGNLLVTVAEGANQNAIAEFDTAGNFLGNFVAKGSGGLVSPFDVYEVHTGAGVLTPGDWLVPSSFNPFIAGSDGKLFRFDSSGNPLALFFDIDDFGGQAFQTSSGNVLVGIFSGAQEGVLELDPSGGVVGVYNPPAVGNNRGVYELPGGNILTTSSSGVYEIDRMGNLVETKLSGVNAGFITFVEMPGVAPPATEVSTVGAWVRVGLALLLALGALSTLRRGRPSVPV